MPEKSFRSDPMKVLEFSQMLDKMRTFDPSDIRLGDEFPFDGLQKINGESYIGHADAEWMEDHIVIYCKKWGLGFPYANTIQYIIFTLNHEYLHHYIFTIMLEDGLDIDVYDGHWPMFAGEIDLICGLSTSNLSRTYFESKESFEISMKLLANCSKKPDWSFV